MTFFRSAVFAILAIQFLLTGICRQPEGRGSTWNLGSVVVGPSTLDDQRPTINEPRCGVLAPKNLTRRSVSQLSVRGSQENGTPARPKDWSFSFL